jgi:phosphoenolpyruvate phosphomutase
MTGAGDTLRVQLARGGLVRAMAAHSPLSARIAEEAGFDALWGSGFELSALYGLPDASLISLGQHLDMIRAVAEQCALPIIADLDTGFGNAVNVAHVTRLYERAGAGAIVIEDKMFPKTTSLLPGGRQELVRIAEFEGKIGAALDARGRMLVIARTEALIAGLGQAVALERAHAYANAGADLILVHSKQTDPGEIEAFVDAWGGLIPLVLVPTSYPRLDTSRIAALGKVAIVIYGNHAIRAAVTAMQQVFARILAEGGTAGVEEEIAPVEEIFRLQRMDALRETERRYLR